MGGVSKSLIRRILVNDAIQAQQADIATTSTSATSASYAITASYAMNGGGGGGTTTVSFTGSFTGSLLGTASYALTASFLSGSVTSASYALTSSYTQVTDKINVIDGSSLAAEFYPVIVDDLGNMIPYLDTSFNYTPSTNQLNVGGITSSLFGTASWAGNVLTASYINPLKQDVSVTGSVNITGSFGLYSFGPTAPVSTPSRVGLFYFTDNDFYISLD